MSKGSLRVSETSSESDYERSLSYCKSVSEIAEYRDKLACLRREHGYIRQKGSDSDTPQRSEGRHVEGTPSDLRGGSERRKYKSRENELIETEKLKIKKMIIEAKTAVDDIYGYSCGLTELRRELSALKEERRQLAQALEETGSKPEVSPPRQGVDSEGNSQAGKEKDKFSDIDKKIENIAKCIKEDERRRDESVGAYFAKLSEFVKLNSMIERMNKLTNKQFLYDLMVATSRTLNQAGIDCTAAIGNLINNVMKIVVEGKI